METNTASLSKLSKSNMNMLWGGTIAETLARLGVKKAVISPGSRSAPLAIGFGTNEKIETIPVLDERSAAFFALGLAKQTMEPLALICSSGTAGANYYPAIIEASTTDVPIIVITADRPKEMQDCNSGQTMDQTKLYGHFVRWQTELSLPELKEEQFRYLRQTVTYAYERSLYPTKGPVHINIPFRDPLAPLKDGYSANFLKDFDSDYFFDGVTRPPRTTTITEREETLRFTQSIVPYNNGIIVVGPTETPDAHKFAQEVGFIAKTLGWSVFAEGLGPLRNCADRIPNLITLYDLILRNPQLAQQFYPETVLCIGALPTSKVLREWLRNMRVPTWIMSTSKDNLDPLHGDTTHVRITTETLALLLQKSQPRTSLFAEAWNALEVRAQQKINSQLEETEKLFEGKAAWLLSQYLPTETPVFVANSMPVRDVEFFWRANSSSFPMHFNRGVNGIDGTLSTALGVAHDRKPAVLLTGDLAFLHDSNGLLLQEQFKGHLTIILINNNGGGIFENLPVSQFKDVFEPYFATPQKVNIQKLVASYGLDYKHPKNWNNFIDLISILPTDGIRLIELKTDRKNDTMYRKELITTVAKQLIN